MSVPVNLDEDGQPRLQIPEGNDHLSSPFHDEGQVEHDAVHGDSLVDQNSVNLSLVQKLRRDKIGGGACRLSDPR